MPLIGRPAAPVLPPGDSGVAAPAAPVFDNIAAVPASARGRVTAVAAAVEQNLPLDFVSTVSSGGFAVGTLALNAEQVGLELAGRSVAELTNVSCDPTSGCRWAVAEASPSLLILEARVGNVGRGALELMRDDDGSWCVVRARPSATR